MYTVASGSMRNLNLLANGKWSEKRAKEIAVELRAAGAVIVPIVSQQETGYWNPAVTTGEDGKATVTFTVPERSTAWKLLANPEFSAALGIDEQRAKRAVFSAELAALLAHQSAAEAAKRLASSTQLRFFSIETLVRYWAPSMSLIV